MSLKQRIRESMRQRNDPSSRPLWEMVLRIARRSAKSVIRRSWSDTLTLADAEDVASETAVDMISGALLRFEGATEKELAAFIWRIVERQVYKLAVKNHSTRLLQVPGIVPVDHADDDAKHAEEAAQYERIINGLSGDEVALLRDYLAAGMNAAEVGRRCGHHRATVKRNIDRIFARIRSESKKALIA